MALGKVSVNNLNLGQGAVTEIERYFLFIGPGPKNTGKLIPLNTDSDLDGALGIPPSDLKTQITAARLNGGDRWACLAAPIGPEGDWQTALEASQQQGFSVEAVVITQPVVKGDELSAMHDAAIALGNVYGRRVFVMAATVSPTPLQTWDEYLVDQKAITVDLAAPRVLVVPQLTLLLDGQEVRGKNLKVTGNLRIESDDLSGQTSNTDKGHKGFKPKTLTVSLMIPFVDQVQLRDLMRLVEATAGGGQLKTYRIVNDTAAAFGMRQVTFTEGVSAREDDNLRGWLIQFTLTEKLSNPEKVEGRRPGNKVTAQSGPGGAVSGTGAAGDSSDSPEELTGFEATLKKVDGWLGGSSPP